MHIVVILRLVPDSAEDLEINEDGTDLDREWIGSKLNDYDDQALEEAILLKERAGVRVTALALAGDGSDRLLQTAAARGVDEAVSLERDGDGDDPKPFNSRELAALFEPVLRTLQADLVMTGVQTPEDVLGQLAPCLAARCGWPTVNTVTRTSADGEGLQVQQEYSGGRSAQLRVALPAVLGIQAASQPPRYVSGSKLREAMAAPIRRIASEVDLPRRFAAATSLTVPDTAGGAQMLSGDVAASARRVVEILREKGILEA